MARSPIRGRDPINEQGSGSPSEGQETPPAAVENSQTESIASTAAVSESGPSEEQSANVDAKPEEIPVVGEVTEASPEPAKAPLKKPLGLSLRKPPAEVKPPPTNKMQIDGAIELTLSAANTAVDAAQEIQRLRAELEMVTAGSRSSGRMLLFATILITVAATAGLTAALLFYRNSFAEFQMVAKTNRDVLMTFAGEVKGLTITSKAIEDTVKVSAQALSASSAQTQEIRKAIQGFTAAQKALEAKIAPASAYEKQFAGLKQPFDELAALNNTITSRLIELEKARIAYDQARKPQVIIEAPKVEAPKTQPKPEASQATNRENLVRYP